MRKISGIISIALASSCLLSICECGNRGRNTDSSVPVDDMEFIVYEELNHTDLPESVRYLDGSRKLKKSYTLEEAQERYAVKLAHSTVICSECDSYVMTCRFCCIDYDANIYSCINSFKLTDQEDFTFPLELKDTELTTDELIFDSTLTYIEKKLGFQLEDRNYNEIQTVSLFQDRRKIQGCQYQRKDLTPGNS